MQQTVSQFKTDLGGMLHGTNVDSVSNLYGIMRMAAGNVLKRIDPYTTKRRYAIENAIYDQIYNYTAPSDMKGLNKIVDLRPVAQRSKNDSIAQRFTRQFDIKKEFDTLAVETLNGTKTLRISKQLNGREVLAELNSLTVGATITAGDDVENLTTNVLDKISGSHSVQFGLDGSTGTGYIEIALANSVDISEWEDLGSLFHWVKFPTVSRLTSMDLRWGSSSSDYWNKTVTAPHDRSAWVDNAWLLNRYDWSSASETGTPDASAVDYLRITFTYSAGDALSNVRVDNVTASLGEVWELIYYSAFLFRGSDGTWKQEPTAITDEIMLEPDSYNIFLLECLKLVSQNKKGKDARSDFEYAREELEGAREVRGTEDYKPGLYQLYARDYPSEALTRAVQYHEFTDLDD